MHLVLFIFFGGLCVAGALNLLLQRHPINSALSLIVVMSSLAVLYLLLGAEFLAAAQVIVYSGAIMVLFTFVIMLLNAGKEERTHGSRAAYMVGIPGVAVLVSLLAFIFLSARSHLAQARLGEYVVSTSDLSKVLFRDLLLPFFSIGVGAFLIKRNIITVFMSIELMLNAVNLSFVAFAYQWHRVQGQIFVFFVMVVAAAEAVVGLAIIIAIFRSRSTLNVDQVNLMKL
jgi:NADH-quinone oxidoreductase subunit J